MTAPRHHRKPRPWYPLNPEERRAAFKAMEARLVRLYGDEIGGWLARRVAKMFRDIRDTYCVDNFRVCDVDIPEQFKAYTAARSAGCCGSVDRKITHYASGRTFRFGCNYGH